MKQEREVAVVETEQAVPAETITLTQEQLDEAIRSAVSREVGKQVGDIPRASVQPRKPGDIVSQRKYKVPPHMKQPLYAPETRVRLTEDAEKNWTWRLVDELNDTIPEGAQTHKQLRGSKVVTYVREPSVISGAEGTVTDLPAHYDKQGRWKVPVRFPGQGVDSYPEPELQLSY